MKSLIKASAPRVREPQSKSNPKRKPVQQAQCCAKISRTVAGCHD